MKCLVIFVASTLAFSANAAVTRFEKKLHPTYGKVKFALSGFTAAQETTIEKALDYLSNRVADIRHDLDHDANRSRFERCTAKYSTKDWINASSTKINNAYWVYTNLVMGIVKHSTQNREVVITAFNETGDVWGRAQLGSTPTGTSVQWMDIQLNAYNLTRYPANYNDWAGTIFHEFQHRHGLVHPSGYEGSMIKEAGLCVARQFADKSFGLADGPSILD